jgi:phenylalanine-4-hydroxylase
LGLDSNRTPRLSDVNRALNGTTGFGVRAVDGYMPAREFFECLRRRQFPVTITVRPPEQLDYLPEPDIFHDVAGHVPMHTDPAFAASLVQFGECARAAETEEALNGIARVFWYTVEFGLIREGASLKACGSGLLSSYGELAHALESPEVSRVPFSLHRAVNRPFEIDHYQPLLMVLDSFEQLFDAVSRLETAVRSGAALVEGFKKPVQIGRAGVNVGRNPHPLAAGDPHLPLSA